MAVLGMELASNNKFKNNRRRMEQIARLQIDLDFQFDF